MTSTVTITIVLLVIVGGVGVGLWYWNKIRKSPSKDKDEASSEVKPLIPELPKQEPIIPKQKQSIREDEVEKEPVLKTSEVKQSQTKGLVQNPVPQPKHEPQKTSPEKNKTKTVEPAKPIKRASVDAVTHAAPALTANSKVPASNKPKTSRESTPPLSEIDAIPEVDSTDEEGLPRLDPFLYETIRINFKNPVPGNQLIQSLQAIKEFDIKPASLVKILAYESSQKHWYAPDAIGMFSSVIFIVQLASKKGSLTDVSFSQLIQLSQRIEMGLDGTGEVKDTQEVSNKIQKLNNLISQFGAQISLVLHTSRSISTDVFEKECSNLGYKRKNYSHYEKIGELILNEQGKRLGNRKGAIFIRRVDARNLLLVLDVALITPEDDPLKLLMSTANAFASVFDAQILDRTGHPITSQTLAMVKQELNNFYKRMRSNELEPSSLRAHKLLD